MLLANAIDEHFHLAAPRTSVYVELFALHEQLAQLAEGTPVAAFMEVLGPEVLENRLAAETLDGNVAHGAYDNPKKLWLTAYPPILPDTCSACQRWRC